MRYKSFAVSVLGLLILIICFCEKYNPADPDSDIQQTSMLKMNFTEIPNQVERIIIFLSNSKLDTLIQEITVTEQQAFCSFENISAGNWILQANALNGQGIVIYTGKTGITVIAGQTINVNLQLHSVSQTGNINVHITWGEPDTYTYIYDFNQGDLSGWSGPANAEIYENMLHLWSVIGWRWHTISGPSNMFFHSGTIEFDIYPFDGGYVFETKGPSASNRQQNWGVWVRWQNDSVYVNSSIDGIPQLTNTQVSYIPNNWYHVKINFDGKEGAKGKFSLWIKNKATGEEAFAGVYDYYAEFGRLDGVNLISLGVYDTNDPRQEERHVYFDNFYFNVLQ